MKNLLSILVFIVLIFSCGDKNEDPIKDYLKYPDINKVIDEFFEDYQFKGLKEKKGEYPFKFEFYKNPTGWHVIVMQPEIKNNKMVYNKLKDEIFWSLDSLKFLPLSYPSNKSSNSLRKKQKYIKEIKNNKYKGYPKWNSYFNMFPYHGYDGSELDNIKLLQNIEDLPDSLLYALGRSYDGYSSILLDSIRYFNTNLEDKKITDNTDLLKKYKNYLHKTIETFEKLEAVNPAFETIVGDISVKLSNVIVNGFFLLTSVDNYNNARKELKDSLYDPFIINIAKNYLKSCDKNAILFTNGDNDTYPLWYVQEFQGFRTDIKVVNLSLFNTDWYIDQMKRTTYDAAPIPSSLKKEEYRASGKAYTAIIQNPKLSDKFTDVDMIMDFVTETGPNYKRETFRKGRLDNYIPTRKLKLKVDKEKAKLFVPEKLHDKIVDEIKWQLNDRVLYKNKLMVLDILANFNWDRPIYFATTVGRDNFMGLEKYFQLEGLAYRFVPYLSNNSDVQIGEINTERMYENLMNNFQWGGLNNPNLDYDETNIIMVKNYRYIYSRLAESLFKKGEKEKAIKVLDKCMQAFPKDIIELSYFSTPIIDIYFKLGETKKGEEMLATMIDKYLHEYIKLKKKYAITEEHKEKISFCSKVLRSLLTITEIHIMYDDKYLTVWQEDGLFYQEKKGVKLEIDSTTYRILTFPEEYYSIY